MGGLKFQQDRKHHTAQEAVAVNCTALSSHNIWTWIDASINDKQIKVEELKSNLSIGLKNEDML